MESFGVFGKIINHIGLEWMLKMLKTSIIDGRNWIACVVCEPGNSLVSEFGHTSSHLITLVLQIYWLFFHSSCISMFSFHLSLGKSFLSLWNFYCFEDWFFWVRAVCCGRFAKMCIFKCFNQHFSMVNVKQRMQTLTDAIRWGPPTLFLVTVSDWFVRTHSWLRQILEVNWDSLQCFHSFENKGE